MFFVSNKVQAQRVFEIDKTIHLMEKFNLDKFIKDAGERVMERFKKEQNNIDFDIPSLYLPVTFTFDLYLKVPIDELGQHGITKEEAMQRVGIHVDNITPMPQPPPIDPKPKGICLQQ